MKQLSFDEINWKIPRKFAKAWPPSGVYFSSDFNTFTPSFNSGLVSSGVVTGSGYFQITKPIKYITINLTVSGVDKYGKNTKD